MAFELDEFREYLKIDKTNLDEELIHHPMLFFQVSEAFVEAAADRDARKEDLGLVDAQLDTEIRDELEQAETKATEGAVKAQIQTARKHQQAFKAYMQAKRQADVLSALKDTFQQRGYMLRDLCSLHVANYYERDSVRGSDKSDKMTYDKTRERLAAARAGKKPRE